MSFCLSDLNHTKRTLFWSLPFKKIIRAALVASLDATDRGEEERRKKKKKKKKKKKGRKRRRRGGGRRLTW